MFILLFLQLVLYALASATSLAQHEDDTLPSVVASVQPSGHPNDLPRLQVRNGFHLRALAAVWHFACPVYGTSVREFKWKATFNPDTMVVKVTAIQNIDKIDKLIIDGADFSTNYHHSVCITIGDEACHYTFRGHVDGTVFEDGIAMSMTLLGALTWDNPVVEEVCVPADTRAPGTCPIGNGVSCRIDRIDVRKLR